MQIKLTLFAVLLFFPFATAQAQLAGTDTAPGTSCTGMPTGATRVTADADTDGASVILICNGTTWEPAAGGAGGTPAGANTELQFNNSGAFGASPNLTWDGTLLRTSRILQPGIAGLPAPATP